jgi:sulfotransferase family protein
MSGRLPSALAPFLRRHRMRGASEPGEPMPFVVGVGRSGTTLLRLMLDAHPQMAIPPETHFVPALIEAFERPRVTPDLALAAMVGYPRSGWPDSGVSEEEMLQSLRSLRPLNSPDAVRSFYRLYASRHGKPRFGDKTPRYVTRLNRIGRALPEARFIHVIRDGRDVALSMNRRLVELRDSKPVPIRRLANRWRRRVMNARANELVKDRYMEVRYEDLVTDTQPTLQRVCDFIELDYDPVMLSYHLTAAERLEEMNRVRERAGRQTLSGEERMKAHALTTQAPTTDRLAVWKTEMSEADLQEFEEAAGDLLSELGYETVG